MILLLSTCSSALCLSLRGSVENDEWFCDYIQHLSLKQQTRPQESKENILLARTVEVVADRSWERTTTDPHRKALEYLEVTSRKLEYILLGLLFVTVCVLLAARTLWHHSCVIIFRKHYICSGQKSIIITLFQIRDDYSVCFALAKTIFTI